MSKQLLTFTGFSLCLTALAFAHHRPLPSHHCLAVPSYVPLSSDLIPRVPLVFDKIEALVIVDSGAGSNVFPETSSVGVAIGTKSESLEQVLFIDGATTAPVALLKNSKLGSCDIKPTKTYILRKAELDGSLNQTYRTLVQERGLLGRDSMRQFDWDIDFRTGSISASPTTIPLKKFENNTTYTLPVTIRNETYSCVVDTGNSVTRSIYFSKDHALARSPRLAELKSLSAPSDESPSGRVKTLHDPSAFAKGFSGSGITFSIEESTEEPLIRPRREGCIVGVQFFNDARLKLYAGKREVDVTGNLPDTPYNRSGLLKGRYIQSAEGLQLIEFAKNSAFEASGFQRGDLILSVDGIGLRDIGLNGFRTKMSQAPNTQIPISIRRDEAEIAVTLVLTNPLGD